jgi:hypothetical protein
VTCPAGHSVTITQLAGQCSIGAVVLVRCASAAPGPRTARPSPWAPTTANLWPLAAKPPTRLPGQLPALAAHVERSIAWLVANGHRRVRYRGLARNQHGLSVRVAAINLRRLVTMGLDHHHGGWVLA